MPSKIQHKRRKDPDLELAARLPYLTKPLKYETLPQGALVTLPVTEFRQLLHHLRSLRGLVESLNDETLTQEQFVAELRADGFLQA